jgi:hypothetical protein
MLMAKLTTIKTHDMSVSRWMYDFSFIYVCTACCLALHVAVSDAPDETMSRVFEVLGLRSHQHRVEGVAMLTTVDLPRRVDHIGDEIGHSCKARAYLRWRVLLHGTCMPQRL